MNALTGRRILVLEEQSSIARLLVEMLESTNYNVIGPIDRIDEALDLLASNQIDAAILDVKVKGEASYAVADDLIRRGIPCCFATGNNADEIAARYPDIRIITKPYSSAHIDQVLTSLLAPSAN